MQKKPRSEKRKYKHVTTGDYCTCAAYIAEIMCMKNAEFQNKGSLPYKFWNTSKWSWTFKRQLMLAQDCIKTYSEQVVVKSINSDDFKGIFSLNNPRCKSIFNKYSKIIEEENSKNQELKVEENPISRKKTYGKRSNINKLRGIEKDGKEIV